MNKLDADLPEHEKGDLLIITVPCNPRASVRVPVGWNLVSKPSWWKRLWRRVFKRQVSYTFKRNVRQ